MTTGIDIQFSASCTDWGRLREATLAAESAGFGTAWVFDHLSGAVLGGDRMLECCTLLGALAASTSRIGLGSLVANVWNREPGTLAVAMASVAEIAGDRPVWCGVGAGTSPTSKFAREQHVVGSTIGSTLDERHERVERTLTLCEQMWSADRDDGFAGFPLPRRTPRTLVGVNSRHLAEIAGRCSDGVNVKWGRDDAVELLDHAERAHVASDRSHRPFERTVYVVRDDALLDPSHPQRRAMDDARIDRLVLADFEVPDPDRVARLRPNP